MKFALVLLFLAISLYEISAGPAAEPSPVPEPAPTPEPLLGLINTITNLLIAVIKALASLIITVVG